jgi:hypothetical protein
MLAIERLTVDNFYRSVELTYDVADEYGLEIEGTGWYIKLCIDRDGPEVVVISFHTPKYPMRTKAGVIRPP